MRALTPWTGLSTMKKEMDRLFERFFETGGPEMPALGEWEPKADISETKEAVVVKAEIPGVDPKEIEASVRDGYLTIKGEKKEEKEEKDERQHRIERSYGAFVRAIRLPAAVDASKATATFKNGVVTVTMPKTADGKGTTIPVKAA
jgi:HSP20 family protein